MLQTSLPALVAREWARVVASEPVPAHARHSPPLRRWTPKSADNPDGWAVAISRTESVSGREFARRWPRVSQCDLPPSDIPFPQRLAKMIDMGWRPRMAKDGSLGVPPRQRRENACGIGGGGMSCEA